MAILDTIRLILQDTGTDPRMPDDVLTAIMNDALMEVNVWTNANWTLTDFDTVPSPVSLATQQIFSLIVKIRVIDTFLGDTGLGMKIIDQDVQLDTSSSASRLNRTKMLLQNELERKLTYWFGLKAGAMVKHTGDQWGGV